MVLDAGFRKGKASVAQWFTDIISLPNFKKSLGNVKACAKSLKPPGDDKAAPAKAPAKKEEKDELDDLFGDDDDNGEAAKKAAAKAKEAKGKKAKKPVIAMSIVFLEVKPLDDSIDLDKLAPKIF